MSISCVAPAPKHADFASFIASVSRLGSRKGGTLLLARWSGLEARAIGLAGLAAGAVPPALLLTGALDMDVAGAFLVYAVQATWGAGVGLHLLRRRAAGA